MNIIEEMRRDADNAERDGISYLAGCVRDWADRLAASGALVPVRDGEECQPHELYPTQFVLWDGFVWVNHPGTRDLVRIQDNHRISVPYDSLVQPVRIVPLAQWEVEHAE